VAFLCPVPGYDVIRALEQLGHRPDHRAADDSGPDMEVVKRLVAEDPESRACGACPTYSNPTGATYSDETVRELASMRTAAKDFRLFWDNAYAIHHLSDDEAVIPDVLSLCADAGNPNRRSCSRPRRRSPRRAAGVASFAPRRRTSRGCWVTRQAHHRPDKLNELRHIRFLPDADSVRAHMSASPRDHQPKFELVLGILAETLTGRHLDRARRRLLHPAWTCPRLCRAVVALAKQAGIALTPAGATSRTARNPGPQHPPRADLPVDRRGRGGDRGLAVCVLLAAAEKQAV